ncbi:NAD(P)H-dependent oxidoreductase subunit E [bacterium]|nr:NAD(P)H-dependent oxidoreductase subunit E [bacterium]
MSPRRAKKTDVDLDNTEALEPSAGDTGAKAPPRPNKSRPSDLSDEERAADEILAHYPLAEPSLIMVLQELNDHYQWLPPKALLRVSEKLGVPFGKVQGVATFYKAFSLEPKGKKTVKVCLGTACHVRGAGMLVDELKRSLKVEPGHGMSEDGDYSLETVNCVGACAMAPVVMVGDNYYANMAPGNIGKMLKKEKPA